MLGVALSAIFTVWEFRWISKDFEEVRLKHAYIAKAIIATTLVLLAIGFDDGSRHDNTTATFVGGILEWVIGFAFVFYLPTFYFDLRMSKGVQKGDKERLTAMQRDGTLTREGQLDGLGELTNAQQMPKVTDTFTGGTVYRTLCRGRLFMMFYAYYID